MYYTVHPPKIIGAASPIRNVDFNSSETTQSTAFFLVHDVLTLHLFPSCTLWNKPICLHSSTQRSLFGSAMMFGYLTHVLISDPSV